MAIHARLRTRVLAAAVTAAVVAQLGFAGEASAEGTPRWEREVARIPTTDYTHDVRQSITDAVDAIRPFLGGDAHESRVDAVAADVANRYYDGARFKSKADADSAYDNLKHLASFVKSRLSGSHDAAQEQAYTTAIVNLLTAIRLLADAAIQDAEATIGPFRANPPPAPAPPGLSGAFGDLDSAESWLDKTDKMLEKANVTSATVHAEKAWEDGFHVLARLGITYDGDHDADGVVDVVELRFGASPLLVDSDSDGLTDKFEINALAGWTMPNLVDTDRDGVTDPAEDVDNDGLTNLQEQDLGTSPTNPDTDGDGASDGAEVAKGSNPLVADQPRAPPATGNLPPIVPAPNLSDTDGDGLIDIAEEDAETDLNNVDSDGDGLSDGNEVNELGIDPLNLDTDGDTLRDDYESVHIDDLGLDPGRFDEQISKWTYVSDFLLGMFAGDFSPRDSMAWLAGNLCSGGLSAIPVVGWILGGLADLRDTIAGVIHGDWVSAGLSILGVVPYVGDAVAIPGKAARFVLRYVHRMGETLRFVTKWDKIPDAVKDLALELILGETYNFLVGDDGDFNIAAFRFSRADIRNLTRGSRTDWEEITDAMRHPLHRDGVAVPPQRNGKAGEDALRDIILNGNCQPQHEVSTKGFPRPRSIKRVADCAEVDPADGELILHEVKTGVPTWSSMLDECRKDAWMLTPAGKAVHGQDGSTPGKPNIKGVHWHFLAHNGYHSIGIAPNVLECLKLNNIPFTIHPPS
jgi:hypothetical protein